MSRSMRWILSFLFLCAVGCGDAAGAKDKQKKTPSPESETPAADAPASDQPKADAKDDPSAKSSGKHADDDTGAELTEASGERKIAACSNLGSGSEQCAWSFKLDPVKCAGRHCTKLVIYFAGGQMTCPDPQDATKFLGVYANNGYVAACARLYETSDGSSEYPYNQEASRVDALIKAITKDPAVQAAWSGEHLLLSGVSHGATAPVAAMATTDSDKNWKGSGYTASCFFDGIYDIPELMGFLKSNSCGEINSVLSYQRAYGRYCAWPFSSPTLPSNWPQPSACASSQIALDSSGSVPATSFAIEDWKLVECGSSTSACSSDVVPAAPIQALCTKLDADGGHSCDFTSIPDKSHLLCGGTTISQCMDWFDGKLAAKGLK